MAEHAWNFITIEIRATNIAIKHTRDKRPGYKRPLPVLGIRGLAHGIDHLSQLTYGFRESLETSKGLLRRLHLSHLVD